jgi:hypothetical protein
VALHHRRARTRAGHLLSLEASEENHQRASLARSLNYINEPKITQANTQQLFSAGAISHKQNPFEGASMMVDHRRARMPSGSSVRDRGITKRSQIRQADGQPFTTVRNSAGNKSSCGYLDPSRSAQDDRSGAPGGRLPNEPKKVLENKGFWIWLCAK